MLTQLHIRDLAIVSAQALELEAGLTALTGETGAGKSILVDALGLALGGRADSGMIRTASDRAEVSADFDVANLPEAVEWLGRNDLDDGHACLVRRVLVREGRSRAFINGRPASLQQLQSLGELLVEIHGQHAHQSLLKRNHQRDLLDAYGDHGSLTQEVAYAFKEYRKTRAKLDEVSAAASERADRLDLLRFQTHELEQLNLTVTELESLNHDHQRLAHMEQLRQGCGSVLDDLDESEPSVRTILAKLQDELEQLQQLDDSLEEPHGMLESALIQVDETLSFLRGYLDGLESDPASLQQLEQRLEEIQDMARKYRIKPEELPNRLEEIQRELSQLDQAEESLSQLKSDVDEQYQIYLKLAERLSKARAEAGSRLGEEISQAMQQLGMVGGLFSVEITPIDPARANQSGLEQVDFQVSANPGMPLQALNKVASGGELSRISLAIQVATLRYGKTPTLVFDEVDVGIGGGVAEIVGQMLRKLGENRQILCVTHLAQVAAQANHQLQVQKRTEDLNTQTHILTLSKEERIYEIARMLGGVKITDQTLAHAGEMLSMASAE
jgi:DNA repair protein RecN (Recombination protein N)